MRIELGPMPPGFRKARIGLLLGLFGYFTVGFLSAAALPLGVVAFREADSRRARREAAWCIGVAGGGLAMWGLLVLALVSEMLDAGEPMAGELRWILTIVGLWLAIAAATWIAAARTNRATA